MFKKVLREPLVHFFSVALALYGLFLWAESQREAPIRISQQQLDQFAEYHRTRFGNTPDRAAVDRYVDELVTEETLYREALSLGLDENDVIVRRRLAQKMEFLLRDGGFVETPDDNALRDYFNAHSARYRPSPRATFVQLYFSPDRSASLSAVDRASATLTSLTADTCSDLPKSDADRFPGGERWADQTPEGLRRTFGDFALTEAVFTTPVNRWQGPYESGLGWHLLCVTHRDNGAPLQFSAVKSQVLQDYLNDAQAQRYNRSLEDLKSRYVVELPVSGAGAQ